MSFCNFILLVAAVLITNTNPASASRELMLTTPDGLAKRLLRSYTTDDRDEERGISAKLPSLEQISNVFKSSKTKELKGLLKADESIENAFKTLQLSKMPIDKNNFIEKDMVVKILSSPNFKIWSNHVTKMNKKNPEAAMLTALTDVFSEKTVATMILLSRNSWNSRSARKVAQKLEKAQFNKWYNEGRHPRDVLEKVLGVKWRDIHKEPREQQIWGAYTTYFKYRVENH